MQASYVKAAEFSIDHGSELAGRDTATVGAEVSPENAAKRAKLRPLFVNSFDEQGTCG